MFDTFKRSKRINAVIGTVKPLMVLYCCDEEGKLLEEIGQEFIIDDCQGVLDSWIEKVLECKDS